MTNQGNKEMENARIEESRNRNDGDAAADAATIGQSVSNGGNVWSDGRDKQTIDGQNSSERIGQIANEYVTTGASNRRASYEVTTGFYHTASGDVRPIPDGHYIDTRDGKLKKRRKRRVRDNSNGRSEGETSNRDRDETDYSESEFDSQTDIRKPLKVRGRRKRTIKEENKKLTMVTLLASGASALFTSVALLTKHDHWALRSDCQPTEAKILAEAINDALDTLPVKYYDFVTSIVERWIPWINLAFVLSALIFDRIAQSEKLIEATRYRPSNTSDERYAASAAQDGFSGSSSSLGFGQ